MEHALKRFETFLGLDSITSTSKLMRARAVYLIGGAFILTQLVNQFAMYHSYGGFTFDHMISAVACVAVVGTVLLLRHTKTFPLFAAIFSVLIVLGVLASALPEKTGINSALIPFFVLGIVTNGFICGWRATVLFGIGVFCTIWVLWSVSAGYQATPIFDVEAFADRNYQRAVQASLATLMITAISSIFSHNMHKAFGELEDGIVTAQSSDRAKTEFLATMSHELCTPMNGIIGVNDLLMESDLDADQRELTDMIKLSGSHLQHIIGNVLLFSQLDAGKIVVSHQPFDIAACANKVAWSRLTEAQDKGLALQIDIPVDLPRHAVGDPMRLGQIIAALLDNAIKFTAKGEIVLALRVDNETAGDVNYQISVRDTGLGIPVASQDSIFERFTQVDGSIKREHGGSGLGLTVAQGLARCMGGQIRVASREGEGSIFTLDLRLPLAESAADISRLAAE